eukprot:m.435303 g.435303  ORF g.435303 m.435303 type:complete len:366 (+) comp17832_c0_seq1:216-1313(+)
MSAERAGITMSAEPTKEQTTEVFKRLRHHAANKMCFDCKSANPSWASIPHGIYLCLQCSGVHRNLGVHLSFVRSTQMDTWTWHQLRCMQAGGNSAATAWFRDHSVTNQDVNAKYSSRGAQLYRAHLEKEASKLDKKLGDQLFEKEKPEEERDVDFFEASAKEAAAGADAAAAAPRLSASASLSKPAGELTASLSGAAGAGSKPAGKKIGGGLKKKAGGIGKKKVGGGLGAVKKTTTNFDEIEKKVTAEDAEREQHESANSPTDGDTERSASSRLKYQESSTKRDISKMNEQKREQAERLGMGMGRATTNKAVFSHSSSAAVQKIDTDYEEGETSRSGFLDREPRGFQDSLGFAGERRSPYDYDDH